jgi:hypothetical protein
MSSAIWGMEGRNADEANAVKASVHVTSGLALK